MFETLYLKLAQPSYDVGYLMLLLVAEASLVSLIVLRVPYTEIDWVAYMQEVTAYQDGERDYAKIRGDTGPLVYPAGFLYLYGWMKSLAAGGDGGGSGVAPGEQEPAAAATPHPPGLGGSATDEAIRRVQWVFAVVYLLNSAIVLALYQGVLLRARCRSRPGSGPPLVWCWRVAMGLTCLSKRAHSIFVLRLFNDAPAMTLLHLSMLLIARFDAWALGCAAFSLAVSIKMNVLLFAPGLLLLLLQRNRCLLGTARHLSICASIQLILGWPFLSTFPASYIKKAFEFDRVFFFEWTVNWKFLPEGVFVCKPWAFFLLACHLGTLGSLARKWWRASISQRGRNCTGEWLRWTRGRSEGSLQLSPEYVIYTMFVSNFVGIAFARTLHYQFYCWYFYSMPMLHLMADFLFTSSAKNATKRMPLSLAMSTLALFCAEYAFNTFPATGKSSVMLQLSHAFLLLKIFQSGVPSITAKKVD